MKNSETRWFLVVVFFFILHSSFEIRNSWANELSVDKRVMQLDDTITITITLEDAFASIDAIRVPLRNLAIDGQPSVSSEFEFVNGQTSRRKTFRYVAHATAPGGAMIGPLSLHGAGGQVETLAPIAIQVLPDAAAGSNDPAKILREMLATNRDPIFLVASADKTSAFEGEEVIVTWTLYNATSVQQYAIAEIPKLEDFWTEELNVRGEQPQQVLLDGMAMQKLPIRRVALFRRAGRRSRRSHDALRSARAEERRTGGVHNRADRPRKSARRATAAFRESAERQRADHRTGAERRSAS